MLLELSAVADEIMTEDDTTAGIETDEDVIAAVEVLDRTELITLEVGAGPRYFAPQMLAFDKASPKELFK